jgi:hypothetical protein
MVRIPAEHARNKLDYNIKIYPKETGSGLNLNVYK